MAGIRLPELPKDKECEEYVAAYFNSAAFYVDRNAELHEGDGSGKTPILELDIHVTDYHLMPPKMTLVEVKSGGWGMAEVFKIRGWMDLLDLQNGLLVNMDQHEESSARHQVANRLGIGLVSIGNLTETPRLLGPYIGDSNVDARDVSMWRFSYWLEQQLIEDLKQKKKTQKEARRYAILDQYLFAINSTTFFCPTVTDKASILYKSFQDNPKITARVGHEAEGGSFDADHDRCPNDIFERTFYNAEYTDLQISTYVEHRARLAILKAAVDMCLYRREGNADKVSRTVDVSGLEMPGELFLPNSFLTALSIIEQEPYFHLYPVFWQWFLWIFGGFILSDHKEKEYSLLSKKTGIPVDNIDQALGVYDLLFPSFGCGKWLMNRNTNIRAMKLFPVPFMGVGANYRRYYHCPNSSFDELNLADTNARKDITKWNNLACEILRRSSRYKPPLDTQDNGT